MREKSIPRVCSQMGKGGVEEVVGAGPDVDEDEGPEVDDGEAVGVNRAVGGLRQKVIHDAEDGRGEEEGHRVVAVPPLGQGILHSRRRPGSCGAVRWESARGC